MSLFDPPLTFVNNDEDNYQQASDSDGDIDGSGVGGPYSSLDGIDNKSRNKRNSKRNKNRNNNNNSNNSSNNDNSDNENENENESSKTSVLTRTKSISHNIKWEIDDRSIKIAKLATKADKRGVIEATVIKDGYDFKLELCASGWRSSQDGYCAFYLTVPNMTDTFVARYRVQFGTTSRVSSIRHDFQLGVGFPNFCHQDTLDSCLTNNICIFNIVIEIFNCESTIKLPLQPLINIQPDIVLSKLMRKIYNNRSHCDVKLVCRNKNVFGHKVVLSHASPVFKAMFSHNLYENNSNEVNMLEWDPYIVEAFIKYLYTAHIDIKIPKNKNNNNNKNNKYFQKYDRKISKCSSKSTSSISTKWIKNKESNNNNNNNNNNNSNSSLLGLDEIDIDESKTWSYNDIFEKKERSYNNSDDNIESDNTNSIIKIGNETQTDTENENENNTDGQSETETESDDDNDNENESETETENELDNNTNNDNNNNSEIDCESETDNDIHGHNRSLIHSKNKIKKLNNKIRKDEDCDIGITINDIIMKSNNDTGDDINDNNNNNNNNNNNSLMTPERTHNKNNSNNNGVSIVDMCEQGVGSPCATRMNQINKKNSKSKSKSKNHKNNSNNNDEKDCTLDKKLIFGPSLLPPRDSRNARKKMKIKMKNKNKNKSSRSKNKKKHSNRNNNNNNKYTNNSNKNKISHINKLSNNATFKLFEIAEFYKVTNLVISCCEKMHREIKIETACDLLIRIHRYEHVKELKQIQESIWIFVSNNIKNVMLTDGYKYILTHYPHLLGQLIEKITN